jgi:hypothetical protein
VLLSRQLTTLAAVASLAACSSSLGPDEDRSACLQTGEFANYGCVEVVGTVVGTQQQGLPDISVGPVYLAGHGAFNTSYGITDSRGRFRFRVYRFTMPQTLPDTVSMYVRAADPQSAGLGVPALLRDSVLVTVTVTPVGRVPTPTTVALSLRTP